MWYLLQMNHSMWDDAAGGKLEYSLRQEADHAVANGARITAAMIRYFIYKEAAAETLAALLLHKSLKQKLWTGSRYEVRQIAGVGQVISERLASAGIHSLQALAETDARRLEAIAQRAYPWGSQVRDAVRRILPPKLQLQCSPVAWGPGGRAELEIRLTRMHSLQGRDDNDVVTENQNNPKTTPSSSQRCPARLLVGTLHDNALLMCRSMCIGTFASPAVFRVKTKAGQMFPSGEAVHVVAMVVHETLLGCDVCCKMQIDLFTHGESRL